MLKSYIGSLTQVELAEFATRANTTVASLRTLSHETRGAKVSPKTALALVAADTTGVLTMPGLSNTCARCPLASNE